ncbi:hypothetical protein E5083_03765 [Streptomyces bauhiniae]|uniref:Uncharacterized protein n=1 Tax=Streptomyces bauhiniae TaxID=2340725 RepID=A0A4Z1DEK8_9ACTN|nr:hypothetical protein [Streptomyces bauhiniae]TGN81636.1 hypothetical protein E5083_03765 [Streptomyces bauhiniae]
MDLEGIGTLSAAAVALIGIPATVLVGRWQLKAAMCTAKATNEAGLAQAEAAYSAALDAVRAESNAAHLQWRRSIQREAYASFLLAANRVKERGERFVMDNADDLSAESISAGRSTLEGTIAILKETQTIIELEGPDSVAGPAAEMTRAAEMIGYYLSKQAIYERAWGKIGRLMDGELPDMRSAAEIFMESLIDLSRFRSNDSSGPDESNAPEAREAQRACREAGKALPPGTLDHEEFEALLEGWASHPPTSHSSYFDASRQFNESEIKFVRAAKIELHATRPQSASRSN